MVRSVGESLASGSISSTSGIYCNKLASVLPHKSILYIISSISMYKEVSRKVSNFADILETLPSAEPCRQVSAAQVSTHLVSWGRE